MWAMAPSVILCQTTVRVFNPAGMVCEACRTNTHNHMLARNGAADCNWERFTQRLRDAAWVRITADQIQSREDEQQEAEEEETGQAEPNHVQEH